MSKKVTSDDLVWPFSVNNDGEAKVVEIVTALSHCCAEHLSFTFSSK